MLQAIRDRAQGWIAWAIVILISIPFALWGIQEYLGVGSEPVVVTVNDREVTESELDRRYHQFRGELRDRLGSAYRPELIDDETLRRQVLEDMIRSELILQESHKLGLNAGDELLRSIIMSTPQFQRDGRFDQETYERALRYQGLTPKQFEQQVRLRVISSQLSRAIEASELVTKRELKEVIRLRNQKRRFDYLTLPIAGFVEDGALPDADIEAYYEANRGRFRVPEQTRVEYLVLNAESIGAKLNPDEETLRGFFEGNRDQFGRGEERRASHILVALAPNADQASTDAAEREIEDALSRIRGGEDFGALAREISDDSGSPDAGGDLGFLERGIMDEEFENAAFSAELDEVTGPIRSRFGFHLIKVTEIKADNVPDFDAQREAVLGAYRRNEGDRLFYEYAERLSDLSYENPDSLEPAAMALGLEIQVSDWIDRRGGSGVLGIPKVVAAAFSEDVLIEGNNSEAVELGPQHVIVLRMRDHEKADVKPLEDVRAEILDLLHKERAAQGARNKADALLERLRAGESREQIAAETGGQWKRTEPIRRDDSTLPVNLVAAAFKLPRPVDTRPVYGSTVLQNQDVALLALSGVTDGSVSETEEPALKNAKLVLQRARGRSYFGHLVQHLRNEAVVEHR